MLYKLRFVPPSPKGKWADNFIGYSFLYSPIIHYVLCIKDVEMNNFPLNNNQYKANTWYIWEG